jgi:hypothetical protein
MSAERSKLYVDLPGFITPSVITGDQLRPDLLLAIENKVLYVLELTVGFETNLNSNSDRKHKKYLPLISDQESNYDKVKFVNVSISSLGVFGQSTNTLTDMLKELKLSSLSSSVVNFIRIHHSTIIPHTIQQPLPRSSQPI